MKTRINQITRVTVVFGSMIVSLMFVVRTISAHPLDETSLVLYLKEDAEGKAVGVNEFRGRLYVSWPQTLYIIEKETLPERAVRGVREDEAFSEYLSDIVITHATILTEYYQQNIQVLNQERPCEVHFVAPKEQTEEVVLGGGKVVVEVSGRCFDGLRSLEVSDRLFIDDFEWQQNVVTIVAGGSVQQRATLNKEQAVIKYLLGNEEVTNDRELEPNRKWWEQLTTKDTSILLLLFLSFLIGGLHTLEAGHSKAVLMAAVVNRRVSLKQALGYAIVFTATHLADIFIIGMIVYGLGKITPIAQLTQTLTHISVWGLLMITTYMLVKELRHRWLHRQGNRHKHSHDHVEIVDNEAITWRQQISLGVLTGLAPCLLGWSLFLAILAAHPTWVVFPTIGAFGLGILTVLMGLAWLTVRVRHFSWGKVNWIGQWSPLLSALLLWLYALWQLLGKYL